MTGALVRSSSALWVGPLVIALGVWYANKDLAATADPYLVARSAAGAIPLFLTAPLAAACAAWEGGRLRRGGWVDAPSVRARLVAVAPFLGPPLAVGLAATAAAAMWTLRIGGVGPIPDLRFLPTFASVVVAMVLAGFAVGVRAPVAVAAPAVLAAAYAWMVVPIAIDDPRWLRHLPGNSFGFSCCHLYEDVAVAALVAPLVAAAGLAVTALMVLYRPPTLTTAPLLVAPLVLGIAGSAVAARDLDRGAEVARPVEQLLCAGATPRVCVWPEHARLLGGAATVAAEAATAWQTYGVAPPAEFTEAVPPPPGGRDFGTWVGADAADLLRSFAYAMLPDIPACAEGRYDPGEEALPYWGYEAVPYLQAWYELAAGAPPSAVAEEYVGVTLPGEPGVGQVVAGVRSLPPAGQRAWLERNAAAASACGVRPSLGG